MNDDVHKCFRECSLLKNKTEIILVSDKECPGYPALKRNWAMARAKGEIYAFLDSDAYPSESWLSNAIRYLQSFNAVCGPGIIPHDAPVSEVAADLVYRMLPYSYRVVPRSPGIVAEYPTFNLVVRKEAATPFDNYLTGEDSLFCRRIKGGVFYHPDILVYHRRRGIFRPLWKQCGTYGRHRGNFIKLALLAWITSVFTYATNFVKGFFMRRPS
jgi:cellulose synthase/poly-beta-1,6-N-acetylglucosamine synthase-like glycosyltransferase